MFELSKKTKLQKLAGKELELHERRKALANTIEDAERKAGVAILDGDAGPEIEQVVRLKAQRDALAVAMTGLRQQRAEAIREQFQGQAVALRETSRRKSQELNGVQSKVAALVSQITEIERVKIVALPDVNEPNGHLLPTFSAALASQIAQANSEAAQLESKAIPTEGKIDLEAATSNREVYETLLVHPSVIPSLDAVEKWLDSCQAASRRPFVDLARRVYLVWNDEGAIDLTASYVYVGALALKSTWQRPYGFTDHHERSEREAAEREAAETAKTEYVDTASGHFRPSA